MAQLHSPIPTPHLLLRRFRPDDVDDLLTIFGDERITRYLYWDIRDRRQTLQALELKLSHPVDISEENVLPVAVVERASERLVGDFMLRWVANEHRQGEIGGSLARDVHGRGYATEIYGELLRLGFVTYGLHRIVANCDARNAASIRSLEKAGLREEAHLVDNEFVKGEWTDEVIMAIRRSEWPRSE